MGKGKRTRAAGGRRERHEQRRPYYFAVVDVHDDDARGPWAADITGHPSEAQQIEPRTVVADSIEAMWRDVHDQLETLGDEVDNIVGTKWMLNGDPRAWMDLADREQLTSTPAGMPVYRIDQ